LIENTPKETVEITTSIVLRGLEVGAKLSWIPADQRDGDYEYRVDWPNGNVWFPSKNLLKELRQRGVELPTGNGGR